MGVSAGPTRTASARFVRRALMYLLLLVITIVSVLPLVWAFTSSLRPDDEIFRYTTRLSWKTLLPIGGTFRNFPEIPLADPFARSF